MGCKARRYQGVIRKRIVHQVCSLAQTFLGAVGPGRRKTHDRRPDHRTHVQIDSRPCNELGEEILVAETGDACRQHLGDREFRPVPNHFRADPALLRGPDTVLQPCLERQIVRETPEQRHRGVRVRVDQARNQRMMRALDDHTGLIRFAGINIGHDVDDAAIDDDDGVLQQYRSVRLHRYAPAWHDQSVAMSHERPLL